MEERGRGRRNLLLEEVPDRGRVYLSPLAMGEQYLHLDPGQERTPGPRLPVTHHSANPGERVHIRVAGEHLERQEVPEAATVAQERMVQRKCSCGVEAPECAVFSAVAGDQAGVMSISMVAVSRLRRICAGSCR